MSDQNDNVRIGKQSPLIPSRTHTYALNTSFYSAVPHPFQQFYMRHVRTWLAWYDGYVDWFHLPESGVFSTRFAYTIAHKLARITVGRKLLFDDEGKDSQHYINYEGGKDLSALQFTESWFSKNGGTDKLKQAVEWAYAGGDALLKLDNLKGGKLTLSPFRKDNYFYNTDSIGNVTAASILVYTTTNIIPDQQGETKELYYLFEERKLDNGVPKWRLSIKKGTGHTLSHKTVDFQSGDEAFRDCPKHIREKFILEYPSIKFNEWMKLPFKGLGIFIVKNTENVSFAPSLPFGESIFTNMVHILMSYDFYFSAKETDVYLGRGKLMIPQHMQNPNTDVYDEGDYRGWDTFLMQKMPYVNPEEQKPIPLQFDLRPEDWERVRNNLIQEAAMSMGISERTLATFVVPASEKPSAYEISSDEDATAAFIEDKRDTLTHIMNELVSELLSFSGFKEDKVYVKFSRVGLTNQNNILNHVTMKRQNGLIDIRTALEELYPDKTEAQISVIYDRIKEEQQEKIQQNIQENVQEDSTVESEQTQQFREMSTLRQTETKEE